MSRHRHKQFAVDGTGLRLGIVAAQFNEAVVARLLDGALAALEAAGVPAGNRVVVRVPGAWEIPVALETMARRGGFDALVALGAVIRGGTSHFEFVAGECSRGVMEVSLRHGLPVGFGVLTCDDEEQALARAGGELGNKGEEAAHAALATAGVLARLQQG